MRLKDILENVQKEAGEPEAGRSPGNHRLLPWQRILSDLDSLFSEIAIDDYDWDYIGEGDGNLIGFGFHIWTSRLPEEKEVRTHLLRWGYDPPARWEVFISGEAFYVTLALFYGWEVDADSISLMFYFDVEESSQEEATLSHWRNDVQQLIAKHQP